MINVIRYELCTVVKGQNILHTVTMPWNEINERIAAEESHNGIYTIEEAEEEEVNV